MLDTPKKDLYDLGELPPPYHVPKQMHAWAIRRERHGRPNQSMQLEVVDTPELGEHDVLVYVMAAGVNYNGVWAGLGEPISPFDVHNQDYHIAGSDASGIVWAVGKSVKRWKPGDEVVIHCNQDDGDDEECNGGDPMYSDSQRIWGYETPDGSFAQFCRVQDRQLMKRPTHLSWEEAACYTLTLATAYRMLFGHAPHEIKPGQHVLVWGASGGLGSFAVQLATIAGAKAIGVVSSEDKKQFVLDQGAVAVLNRKDFNCWGQLPTVNGPEFGDYMKECRKFGKAIREITGGKDLDMVFEHPGESTMPVSVFLVKRGGMVVICAGTTGFNLTMDARFLWMRQKRVQGSHFANLKQAAAANELVCQERIDPCMSEVFPWAEIPAAHEKMLDNKHLPGNMAVLVNAPKAGMKTLEGMK
ncbi:crotonyl-CoA carboxylase/reductase [Hirschia baltica]|uniref:Crotonyl-CoA reductase n=1 Tax=Hirschia baltica (strain ATCC 49814 / DSM 5838 / IFAM 1418) TaxID=582402 RepID=C6XLT4_HIRBI|nr:crotonyl-CoA carboxylase/reductase [Hirschia baltica]ACT57990.1 crotonyl-CoA reductase [Hirschia baltica ATCC 49814]